MKVSKCIELDVHGTERSRRLWPGVPPPPIPPPPDEDYYAGLDPSNEDDAWAIAGMPNLIADDHNQYIDERDKYFQEVLPQALAEQLELLNDRLAAPDSPLLTLGQAAAMLGFSPKRLSNLMYEWKRDHGKLPDFVCTGAGRTNRRIDRDRLVEFMRTAKPRRGRPRKCR